MQVVAVAIALAALSSGAGRGRVQTSCEILGFQSEEPFDMVPPLSVRFPAARRRMVRAGAENLRRGSAAYRTKSVRRHAAEFNGMRFATVKFGTN